MKNSQNPIQQIFKALEQCKSQQSQSKKFESRKVLALLIEQIGASNLPSLRDGSGNTIVHTAISQNQVDVVQYLLLRYADLRSLKIIKNGDGLTPLALAEQKDLHHLAAFLRDPDSLVKEMSTQFVTQFVNRFFIKFEKYMDRDITSVISHEKGDNVPEANSSPPPESKAKRSSIQKFLLPVATAFPAGRVITTGLNFIPTLNDAIGRIQSQKAKKASVCLNVFRFRLKELVDLGHAQRQYPREFEETLIRTAFEIFSAFEQYFIEHFTQSEWYEQQASFAQQAVDRMMNYVNDTFSEDDNQHRNHNNNNSTVETRELCKFFMLGKPNGAVGNFLVIEDKWSEVIRKSGAVTLAKPYYLQNAEYFISQNSFADIFGFRKLFQFEQENGNKNHEFKVIIQIPWNAYNFLLDEKKIDTFVHKVQRILQ